MLIYQLEKKLNREKQHQTNFNEPSQQSTARRIFHKIQFHEVFIRRGVSEMENFPPLSLCGCGGKVIHQHHRRCLIGNEICKVGIFPGETPCAACWNVPISIALVVWDVSPHDEFYTERKMLKISACACLLAGLPSPLTLSLSPHFQLPWDFTFSWNDINLCRKGEFG